MEQQEGIRINKFLSEAGVCSRREADRALEAGQIRIGERVAALGDRVRETDTVYYKGKPVRREEERILIAFHKPKGVVCTTSKKEGVNIVDFIGYPKRIYPVGRLDKDSTGLILLTNDGDIVNKMMRSGNRHEKEYVVKFSKDKGAWFTVWNNNIIAPYNGEKGKPVIPMRPYLDEVYSVEGVKAIMQTFDTRSYQFRNLITFKKFQSEMTLLKPRQG